MHARCASTSELVHAGSQSRQHASGPAGPRWTHCSPSTGRIKRGLATLEAAYKRESNRVCRWPRQRDLLLRLSL